SRLRRLLVVNGRALRVLWARRARTRSCYVRHLWGQVPSLLAARALGYRVVTQVDDMAYGPGYEARGPGVRAWLADHTRRRATARLRPGRGGASGGSVRARRGRALAPARGGAYRRAWAPRESCADRVRLRATAGRQSARSGHRVFTRTPP